MLWVNDILWYSLELTQTRVINLVFPNYTQRIGNPRALLKSSHLDTVLHNRQRLIRHQASLIDTVA